jgi:ASPM-SPD-2-Hydin domain-containing protein/centrosomal CEP192-like protein/NHL repeat-containing protein
MRAIRYVLIAILLLSATTAHAQNSRLQSVVNHSTFLKHKVHHPNLAKARPLQTTAAPFLYEPASLAFDTSGNLYIAAPIINEILEVTPEGQLSIFAGTGARGFSGDGGPAVDAVLDEPFGVAVDSSGDVFIADTFNSRVREVTTDGNINTVAGGTAAACTGTDSVGDGCPALDATLDEPFGVAIDGSGDLLIADTLNALVRIVTKSTQIITVVAGGGPGACTGAVNDLGDNCPGADAVLFQPVGLAVDQHGNIFIADDELAGIRVVNSSGVISLYAGTYLSAFTSNGVAATSTTLYQPLSVAVDSAGDLFIADNITNEVREVNATSKIITNVAGNVFGPSAYGGDGGPATSATFVSLWGVAVSPVNGNVYIADEDNNQVRVVNGAGTISTFVAPSVTFPSTIIDFNKTVLNTASPAQTIQVTNTSGAALTISGITFTNSVYSETDNCIDTALAAGQTCQIFLTLTPTALCDVSGSNDADVTITHDGPGGQIFLFLFGEGTATGGLTTDDLTDESLNPTAIAQALVGTGVTVSNVTYTGAAQAAGTFAGGQSIFGFDSGVILSSGSLANSIGPNCDTGITANNGQPGDTDLQTLVTGGATMDAAVLEFDFVPVGNSLNFQYVFASDEYTEHVGFFDDVFGFFVNGTNAALLPGTNTPVSINTVNNGNSVDSAIPVSNPQFFIDNNIQYPSAAPLNTEMDGLTVVLSVQVAVNAGVTNHIKLAIADTGDHVVDSNVFIKGASLNSSSLNVSPGTLAFGNVATGATSAAQIVTLMNSGSSTVDFTSIAAAAPFGDTTTCGATLTAGQSCTVSVTFSPTAASSVQELLTITSNAAGPDTVQTVSLSGTGVNPLTITITPSLTFPAQAQNTTSNPMTVTVTNNDNSAANWILSSATITGPFAVAAGGTCAIGGNGIPPDNSCTILVTFTPTGTAPSSGTLTLADNATGNPHSVALSGTTTAQATPTVSVTPPTLTFPAQAQNTTSAPMTVTVKNTSTTAINVTFSNISPTGPFAVSGGTCSTTGAGIAQNASCTILVTFTPTGTAPSSGKLSITDNAAGSPQSVTLSGTTTAQAITVTVLPGTLTFPAQAQNTTSAAMTVTVKNTSTSATNVTFSNISTTGPFAVSGGTCSTTGAGIAQNASCTITVTFTPTGTAPSSGKLSITDNAAGSPQSVTLSGTTFVPVTTVTVTPATVTFPAQAQNTTSAPMTVTVKNTSTNSETLTFSSISTSGPFAVSGGTCSTDASPLPAGSSCTILVTFTPTGTAASSGMLSIADNATPGTQSVTLKGTTAGQPTVTVTPETLNFPATLQNTASSPMSVTVKNTSTASQTITFSNISTGEGPFAVSGGTCSTDSSPLAAGSSCTIAVTFTPTGTAPSSGTLTITDNAASSPQSVTLNGTTLVPQIAVQITPGSLTFPATLENTASSPMSVTVKNTSTGGGTISFSNISTGEGPFAVTGGTCSTDAEPLPAGMSCTIAVTFTPSGTNPSSGTLTITDNAANSPQNVPLNGTTLVPQTTVTVTPASLTFPPTTQGTTTAAMNVTVKNTSTNGSAIFFSNFVASGPFAVSGGTCAITNDGGPPGLAVGASCTIGVTFTPSGTNPSSGTLTITDNAVDSPQSVALSGTTLVPQTFTLTVGGNGGSTAIITPGDTVVFPIILTGSEGATGIVDLSCTPNTPTITCNVTPTSITLNGTTSVNTGISVITFCSWAPPPGGPFGPRGRFGDPRRLAIPIGSLAGLLLMLVLFARADRRRWAPGLAAVVFLTVGLAGCKSLAKGPDGATPPGTYTLTLTGTLNGQSQSLPLTLIVKQN